MKLNEIKQALLQHQIHLTKSLGQNFLHDANQLRKIIQTAQITPGDQVLEIGPGFGPLTAALLDSGARVLAIEKDERLFHFLEKRFHPKPQLTLLHADALQYLQQHPKNWQHWKLVANLPYSVASPILVVMTQSPQPPDRLVATLQIEVAKRIMAGPDHPDYGLLTLLIQLCYTPITWFKIPAASFFPVPNVDSACITLTLRPQPLLNPIERPVFEKIVKIAFSQRRKMMFKLLKNHWPTHILDSAFASINLPQNVRAERVPLDLFIQLTQFLTKHPNEPR